jgi:hypothetical protein
MFFTVTQCSIVREPVADRLTNVAPRRTLLDGFIMQQQSIVRLDRNSGAAKRLPKTSSYHEMGSIPV